MRELTAIAHLVVRQPDACMQGHLGIEPGFGGDGLARVEHAVLDADLGQQGQPRLCQRQILFGAKQHKAAFRALVVELQAPRDVAQPLTAEQGQALHRAPVRWIGGTAAGAPPLPHPRDRLGVEPGIQVHRRISPPQRAQHLAGHARRRPGRDVAGGDHPRIGKARFRGDAAASLVDRDLVAVDGQFVGGGHADDAGADDCDAHDVRTPRRPAVPLRSPATRPAHRRRAGRHATPSVPPASRQPGGRAATGHSRPAC